MSAEADFSIRTASASDALAVRMLLPSAADSLSYCLVAEAGDPPKIVGAAGITHAMRPKPPVGPGVAVEVIEPCRRRGIARRLIKRLAEQAKKHGAAALYATQKVDADSDAMQAWSALGFSPCETVQYHELPLDEFEIQLSPLLQRMRERGKIPETARIIPLYAADIDAVAKLHLEVLGGNALDLMQKLRGDVPDSYLAHYSQILLLEGRVVGFILAHRVGKDVAFVDANVLAPDVRGGWANVWLKLEATRGARQLGIEKFVFTSFDHYQDTRSFTERMQGVTVETKVLMYLPLATT